MIVYNNIKIPSSRIAILIGSGGKIKKQIEEELKVKLEIESSGSVNITGESINVLQAEPVIKAIGRGFAPLDALLLLNENFSFDLINIIDYSGKSEDAIVRLKGRVIGYEGKSRENIEKLTNTIIRVSGRTIGIIGKNEDLMIARTAVILLLEGRKHNTVYHYIRTSYQKMIKM